MSLPPFASQVLHLGPVAYSAMYAAIAVGAGAGAVVLARRCPTGLRSVTLAAAIAVPLLLAFVPMPAWRLELISAAGQSQAQSVEPASHDVEPISRVADDLPTPPEVGGIAELPLDEPTILASVQKTGRAIVVHEAAQTLGVGAEVAARIQEHAFYHLEAPVLRATGFDTPYPPAKLEEFWLPDVDRILDLVERSLAY